MVYGTIGSVSSGTMREEDLIPAFVEELERLNELSLKEGGETEETKRVGDLVEKIRERMANDEDEVEPYYGTEEASNDLNDTLFNELNHFAPPFCSFGSSEGDGADYGFWWSQDSYKQSVDDGEIYVVDDLGVAERAFGIADQEDEDESGEPEEKLDGYHYVSVVSDHGNIEMYAVVRTDDRVELKSLYGIV